MLEENVFNTHRATNDHGRRGIVVAEVEREFHAGIPAPDDEDILSPVFLAGLVFRGVDFVAGEVPEPLDIRGNALRILAGGNNKPPTDVLCVGFNTGRRVRGYSFDPPEPAGLIVPSGLDALVELRLYVEAGGVGFEVLDELFLGWVLGEVLGEGHFGKLAELFREVKLKPIISPLLPQGGNAIRSLQDHKRHALLLKARRRGEARRPGADDDRAVDQHAPAIEEVSVINKTKYIFHFLLLVWGVD